MADYKVWVYCDPIADICISAEAWAAWAGAAFASLAIGASFWILTRQLRAQEGLHKEQLDEQRRLLRQELEEQSRQRATAERERELMQLNRALLAIDGYLNGFESYAEQIARVRPTAERHFSFPHNKTRWLVPMDQDSLAFLVHRKAQSLLNEFSHVHGAALQWDQMVNDFSDAIQEVSPALGKLFTERKGQPLDMDSIVSVVGHSKNLEIAQRAADLERYTRELVRGVSESAKGMRLEILRLYPGATLPDEKAGTLLP
jgi:hypothetical protein